jgi:hypothetical protein
MPFLSVYGGPRLNKRARESVSAIATLSEQCAVYCLRMRAVLARVGLGGEPVRPMHRFHGAQQFQCRLGLLAHCGD